MEINPEIQYKRIKSQDNRVLSHNTSSRILMTIYEVYEKINFDFAVPLLKMKDSVIKTIFIR